MAQGKAQERPADTPFKQQRLPAWQPILTPKWVVITFSFIGVAFIPIGVVIVNISDAIVEVVQRYDDQCPPPPSYCTVNVTIPADMAPPIYFYYQLTNFYQNHRRYVQSRSDAQLRGVGDLSQSDLSNCEPIVTSPVQTDKVLYPCGLVANSFFTDQFNASLLDPVTGNETALAGADWDGTSIAWATDVQTKFKLPQRAYAGVSRQTARPGIPNVVTLPSVTNQEFIVWMRTAGLPTFKKLNRVVGTATIAAGTKIQFSISNQFPVRGFNGQKALVLSTASVLGGKNPFLGYAYITVGAICLFLAFAFQVKHYLSPRTLGDMTYFAWNTGDRRVHAIDAGAPTVGDDKEAGKDKSATADP